MLTVAPDGSDLHIVDENGLTSHFIWRDSQHILAWSKYQPPGGFFLFEDKTGGKAESVLTIGDGHCTYLPGDQWMLADTYPDKDRNQHPYLYHLPTQRRIVLGDFRLPKEYEGEWRCDAHPLCSPDGRSVLFESPHDGTGRQMYLIDISGIVG
jgi:Tol biopolymer transport system component